MEAIDRTQQIALALITPGIFERLHNLCGMADTLMAFYESPDEVRELVKLITEVELEQAEAVCDYLRPEGILHADDWGTATSTFMSLTCSPSSSWIPTSRCTATTAAAASG